MGLFKVYRFFQEASDFAEPDHAALQAAGDDAGRYANYHRTIVRVSCVCGALGFALGVAGWILTLNNEESGHVEGGKGAIGMMFMPVLFTMPGLLLGAAVSCLVAPREFLAGPLGQKWMKLIGTQSVAVARFVCFLVAVILGGVPTALALVILFKGP